MTQETVGQEEEKGYQVSLYKTQLADGKHRFVAEAFLEDGDKFMLDHWNLSSLQRLVKEIVPVVRMAKAWQRKAVNDVKS